MNIFSLEGSSVGSPGEQVSAWATSVSNHELVVTDLLCFRLYYNLLGMNCRRFRERRRLRLVDT
jgi:hypothetical protein